MSMKNSIDTIVNRTTDLSACRAVPCGVGIICKIMQTELFFFFFSKKGIDWQQNQIYGAHTDHIPARHKSLQLVQSMYLEI
jgi:hypothetical protein